MLILWPFVKTQSFSNFAWFFDRWAKDYVGNGLSLLCFGEAHWSVSTKETRFNGIPQCIIMKGYSRHNSLLIGRKNQAKFDNDRISRNGHRIKTTQPNLMMLVSFSSAEDVWSNDVNRYTLLARNVQKIHRSAFSGTPGIVFQNTVNAVIFAWLNFRVWQPKNIFAGC